MSLLKRIQEGQGRPADQPSSSVTPSASGGGANDAGAGLSSLAARRVSAPPTTPQAWKHF